MSQPATDREREGSRLNFRDTIPGPFTFKPLNSGYNEMTATKASVRNEKPRSMAPTLTTHKHFGLVLRDLPVDRHEDKMIESNMMANNTPETYVRVYEIVSGTLINKVNTRATASMIW